MKELNLLRSYAATRDPQLLDRLIRKYHGMVLGVCLSRLGDVHDAEDAAQQVFLALMQQADRIRTNLGGWLYSCAVNTCVSTIRSKGNRRKRERMRSGDGMFFDVDLGDRETSALLEKCLADLAPVDREMLVENHMHSRSQRDIASRMGISQQAVAKRIGRAKEQLRWKLQRKGVMVPVLAFMLGLLKRVARAAWPTRLQAAGSISAGTAPTAATSAGPIKLAAASFVAAAAVTVGSVAIHPPDSQPPAERDSADRIDIQPSAYTPPSIGPVYVANTAARGVQPGRPEWAHEPASTEKTGTAARKPAQASVTDRRDNTPTAPGRAVHAQPDVTTRQNQPPAVTANAPDSHLPDEPAGRAKEIRVEEGTPLASSAPADKAPTEAPDDTSGDAEASHSGGAGSADREAVAAATFGESRRVEGKIRRSARTKSPAGASLQAAQPDRADAKSWNELAVSLRTDDDTTSRLLTSSATLAQSAKDVSARADGLVEVEALEEILSASADGNTESAASLLNLLADEKADADDGQAALCLDVAARDAIAPAGTLDESPGQADDGLDLTPSSMPSPVMVPEPTSLALLALGAAALLKRRR